MWKFSMHKDNECLHHLYWYASLARSVSTPHTVQVWSIVYLCIGLSTTFFQINEHLHTFFFFVITAQEMLRYKTFIIMKRFISFFLVLFAGCLLTTSCENEDFGGTAKHSYTVTSELGAIGANSLELRFYVFRSPKQPKLTRIN